ncbi:MAG: hypothetical protein ACREGL_08975 [Alphaproteobacteria bacterium]
MYSDAKNHALYQIANAPMRPFPYPHFYVTEVFPAEFYAAMLANLPAAESYRSLAETGRVPSGAYKERSVFFFEEEQLGAIARERATFWLELAQWLLGPEFINLLAAKFDSCIQQRFAGHSGNVRLKPEAFLVKDRSGYSIGPHSDAPHRLLSLLFYLPRDERWRRFGTSLFLPKDRSFTCEGGRHHGFERFDRIATMAYVPNTLFGFVKTDNSFHGVEPVDAEGIERDLLLYDIRLEGEITKAATPDAARAA